MRISDWSSDVCSSDLPPAVLARAKDVLARLEEGKAKTGGIAAGLDELPLFAAIADAPRQEKKDAGRDAGQAREAEALSPREALDLNYRRKQKAEEKASYLDEGNGTTSGPVCKQTRSLLWPDKRRKDILE